MPVDIVGIWCKPHTCIDPSAVDGSCDQRQVRCLYFPESSLVPTSGWFEPSSVFGICLTGETEPTRPSDKSASQCATVARHFVYSDFKFNFKFCFPGHGNTVYQSSKQKKVDIGQKGCKDKLECGGLTIQRLPCFAWAVDIESGPCSSCTNTCPIPIIPLQRMDRIHTFKVKRVCRGCQKFGRTGLLINCFRAPIRFVIIYPSSLLLYCVNPQVSSSSGSSITTTTTTTPPPLVAQYMLYSK